MNVAVADDVHELDGGGESGLEAERREGKMYVAVTEHVHELGAGGKIG